MILHQTGKNFVFQNSIVFSAPCLLSLTAGLSGFYEKQFVSTPQYDEEEERTVRPNYSNAYQFTLSLNKALATLNPKEVSIFELSQ